MITLDEIIITQPANTEAHIQLLYGDLTALTPEQNVDILIVSAFPNDYNALPGSLFYYFDQKGFSVAKLAENKLHDFRSSLSCWISQTLSKDDQAKFNFKQLLCLEPLTTSANAVEIVGNIFRCLNNFAFDDEHNSIAMPIVASGKQQVPVDKILPALMEAAIFWLKQGLPLEHIRIVIHDESHVDIARKIFTGQKDELENPPVPTIATPQAIPLPAPEPIDFGVEGADDSFGMTMKAAAPDVLEDIILPPAAPPPIDIFISYSHKQQDPIEHFVNALRARKADLNIFYDRDSINGGQWLRMISDAIARAKKVIVFLSPDYSHSPVCWDEFQCAKVIEYNQDKQLIQTIYLMNDVTMPPIMAINSWIDCRENDLDRLAAACADLVS